METRAAIVEDGSLAELLVERPIHQRVVGNIYRGRVENVLPGMEAAFVDIGIERNAFLYVGDTQPLWHEDEDGGVDGMRPEISEVLGPRQEITVQVVKEPIGTKGARVTTHVNLPGRYVVLMPTTDYVGVSRRIGDDRERQRLRGLLESCRPPGVGVIARTVAEGRSEAELKQDLDFVLRLWGRIQRRERSLGAPALLHKDLGLSFRIVRDLLSDDVERLWLDSRSEYERVLELCEMMSPDLKKRVRLYQPRGGQTLFEYRNIETEIDRALRRKVWLKCGGYLVIDQTEALTVVDVNTGKYVGSQNLEATVLRANLEAAQELARQIRLRDIAGIIVVDFIDMQDPRDRQEVLQCLDEAVKMDRTKVHVLGLTQLGLVEMTRKKVGLGLEGTLMRPCPTCEGRGRVLSEESMSQKTRRDIKTLLQREQAEAILVEVNPQVASLLIGSGGANLKELERETGRAIYIRGAADCRIDVMRVRAIGARSEVERLALPVHVGEVLDLTIVEGHATHAEDGIARVEGYIVDIEDGFRHLNERVKVAIVAAYRTYAKGRIVGGADRPAARTSMAVDATS